ncbi:MAG: type II toxin-antitoxin system PemK/MazF family toxin, partial [Rubrobacteraceae bacterium]
TRGDIWSVDLEPIRGSEMSKQRPCVVVSNDIANRYSPVVTVVAVTSQAPKKAYPFMVEIPESVKMTKRSWVTCAHIRTVDKTRLGRFVTRLDPTTVEKVNEALAEQLDIVRSSVSNR